MLYLCLLFERGSLWLWQNCLLSWVGCHYVCVASYGLSFCDVFDCSVSSMSLVVARMLLPGCWATHFLFLITLFRMFKTLYLFVMRNWYKCI
ncbi:MAG: hypothetical protein [Cressdnaviricota sp.]|nr:MAG: hypothetical protein [Cressdnaviricota sp.]